MALIIFSAGPEGPTQTPVRRVSEVERAVRTLEEAGHTNLRVGTDSESATGYDQWAVSAQGVQVRAVPRA